jgi:helicase
MKVEELIHFGLPDSMVDVLKAEGIEELFEPQEVAVNQGILGLNDSYMISVPTASGKTLIAELVMVASILREKKKGNSSAKCLYIVPLRALASEKFESFKKWESLGITVGVSTGDLDSTDPWLSGYDIVVATSEKVDSLTRHDTGWLKGVTVLVVDEIHLVHDSKRGPTLEVVIARMRHLLSDLLILALSATVQNAGEIAGWLDAKLIESTWRPVELREGVYYNHSILFNDSQLDDADVEGRTLGEIATSLALDAVSNGGQTMVFLNTRRSVESFADRINLRKMISDDEADILSELSDKALNVLSEPTKTCRRLAKCIGCGVAFHHAGLLAKQRKIVEDGFKANHIKIVSATPTLAAGVNLPARRVVIKDYQRYDANFGRVEIPVLEYKQMAGRAGRPGYDEYGEAILLARTDNEKDFLLDSFILAEPEKIFSKLAIESALRSHVLSSIASNFANSSFALSEFFSKTLYAFQREISELDSVLERVVEFLEDEGMIERKGQNMEFIVATPFGRRVAQLYIDPISAVILRDSLTEAEKKSTKNLSYLHAIARTGELGSFYLRKGDLELFESVIYDCIPILLTGNSEVKSPWDHEALFSEIKMASFLTDWTNEFSEEEIREKYNIAPGDIRNKVEIAGWMLYSMREIGRLIKSSKANEIRRLETRLKYGVKEDLFELVSLKGVGRVRARNLYRKGYKNLKDLKKADAASLARVETIGEKIAGSILNQLKNS